MKGAIIGDIIGSAFKNDNRSTVDFQLFKPTSSFTDDTILTLATADSVIHSKELKLCIKEWMDKYPAADYNQKFKLWAESNCPTPFNGTGDGSARRISPIGMVANSIEEALTKTEESSKATHKKAEKITASKAATAAIFLAKNGANKTHIKSYIEKEFGYDLNKKMEELHEDAINPELETPVPIAINLFLKSNNYEDAIRKAISIGGPSNTIGSITGAIAHAYFKHIPKSIVKRALNRLTPEMVMLIDEFEETYLHQDEENNEILIAIH